jgi:hypothetical protein
MSSFIEPKVGDYCLYRMRLARVTEVNICWVDGVDYGDGERVPKAADVSRIIYRHEVSPGIDAMVGREFASIDDAREQLKRFRLPIETELLNHIADKRAVQEEVAWTYSKAMESGTAVDWDKVTAAILGRWSPAGLLRIKKRAEAFLPSPLTPKGA